MNKINKPIILIGFKHAGKSVIGAALAKKLQWNFTDLDRLIEEHYHRTCGEGLNCRNIAKKHGIDYFRALESEMLMKAMASNPEVLALGGGTPILEVNQDLIRQGTVIHIQSPKGQIFERIMIMGRPAFFPEGEDAYDAFIRIWEEREPIYLKLAKYRMDNTGTIDQGVNQILSSLQRDDLQ